MVRVSKTTLRSPKLSPHLHWMFLSIIFFTAALFGLYLHLSSKEQRMHENMIRASRSSALGIIESGKPYIIYGTAWKEDQTSRLVSEAIRSGFRFVDTACQPKHYREEGVGEGWSSAAQELGLRRSDLFLQTKFSSLNGQDPNSTPYDKTASLEDQVRQSVEASLVNLRTSYLDSLVLHSPMSTHEDTMTVWRVFESLVDEKKVLGLGVSNCYDLAKFVKIYDGARVKPAVLQNRFYSKSGFDVGLRNFCKDKGIQYQSFWTLTGNRKALKTTDIEAIAARKKLTPSTLMYAYMMTLGHTPLSGTTSRDHMDEDIAIMRRIHDGEEIFKDDELKKMSDILGIPT
uniref:NADP-dependent oxidoreductase domain-containing protein n=1 Tax=Odontella aurita TaxID=265563 RepID=A0A7S4N2L4_9STRA|mmetsp:Transcript_44454/g.135494  ORF Transcript_44454/g.135494 Transcript_44454/m.135494 type:complete len:344 (+) Transcript_44454:360-1391(+)